MSNPFATVANAAAAASPETAEAMFEVAASVEQAKPKKTAEENAASALGMGDPFAAPVGVGDGSRITEFVDRLLLIKPTEIIEEMNTKQGKARNVVRADIAVLDDPTEPGTIIEGVLLFQQALKREAANIYKGPLPYLLGRLNKGKTGGGNDLYTFEEANGAETTLARQFLAVKTL